MPRLTIHLEPTHGTVVLEVTTANTVGDVIRAAVGHLRDAPGFDLKHYLETRIGQHLTPTWQLLRHRGMMQLLPPGLTVGELDPVPAELEAFTLQVAAVVA